jgi:hypothetical protein
MSTSAHFGRALRIVVTGVLKCTIFGSTENFCCSSSSVGTFFGSTESFYCRSSRALFMGALRIIVAGVLVHILWEHSELPVAKDQVHILWVQ